MKKCACFTVILLITALPLLTFATSGLFDELDLKLLHGNLDAAKEQIDRMFKTRSIVTSEAVKSLSRYKEVLNVLVAIKDFQNATLGFEESQYPNEKEFIKISTAYSNFNSNWSALSKNLPISRDLLDHLNNTRRALTERFTTIESTYQEAGARREQIIKEEEKRRISEYNAAKERQLALIEAETKKIEVEEKKRKIAHNAKIDRVNDVVIKAGYKGLNKKFGIRRFLYHAAREGSLETGLNEVFWTKLSAHDEKADNKWRLSQLIDGWEIYEIEEWSGREMIHLTITVKSNPNRLPMQGQRLKDEYYVFKGNMQFVSVTGTPMIIQQFLPVRIDTK